MSLLALGAALVCLAACGDSSPKAGQTAVIVASSPTASAVTSILLTRSTQTGTTIPPVIDTPEPSALTQDVDDYLSALVEEKAFSGVVLLAQDGKVEHLKGYGMADAGRGEYNAPQTRFEIGSLTKAFTAVAIMILQEQGRLSVQDRACKYVQGCPPAYQSITIHHLLTHTSGITDLTSSDVATATPPPGLVDMSFQQMFDLIKGRPLAFEPGSKFAYSNTGYAMLGHIIKQVSGEEYTNFISNHILAPLGMANSNFDRPDTAAGTGIDSGAKNRAIGYSEPGKPAQLVVGSLIDPVGGLWSTAGDLFLWDQALYTDKLLSKASLSAIFTPNLQEYGYAWVISEGSSGRMTWHDGEAPGFVSIIYRYERYIDSPDRGPTSGDNSSNSTVIVLSNDESANLNSIQSALALMLFKQR